MRQHRRLLLGLRTLAPGRRLVAGGLAAVLVLAATVVAPSATVRAQELAPPRMWLDPDCIAPYPSDSNIPEIQITVHGHNFTPGEVIDIFSWEAAGEFPPPEATVTVDGYGTFDQPISVRQPLFAREYTILAYDRTQIGTPIAEVEFHVPCKGTVTVDPPCADPPVGDERLEIRVEGRGWFDHEGFAVRFLNLSNQALDEVGTPVVGGAFDVTLRPPNPLLRAPPPLVAGVYVIIVVGVQVASSVTLFPVPCQQPQIDLRLPCGPAGAPPDKHLLQISGSGFLPLPAGREPPITIGPRAPVGYVEILFDVDGKRQEFLYQLGIPEGGGWGPVPIDPYLRPDDPYTVRVRQLLGGYVLLETTATFTVPCGQPRIELDPVCGPPAFDGETGRRYDLTVRGFDFIAGTATVTFDAFGQMGVDPLTETAKVEPDGTFTHSMTPLARPIGRYEVHVGQDPPREGLPVIAEFTVPCEPKAPEITVRCDPEEPEAPDLAELLIEGTGFFEDAPIFLAVGGNDPEPLQTGAQGQFTHRIGTADLPEGVLDIAGSQRDVRLVPAAEAMATIVLPCGTPATPLIRIFPETAPPGFVVLVEGTFFPPGTTVLLHWNRGLGSAQAVQVAADENGTFRRQVLIFHRDFLGAREMTASSANDPATLLTEEAAQLLVVAGRGSPPAFLIDGAEGPIVIRR